MVWNDGVTYVQIKPRTVGPSCPVCGAAVAGGLCVGQYKEGDGGCRHRYCALWATEEENGPSVRKGQLCSLWMCLHAHSNGPLVWVNGKKWCCLFFPCQCGVGESAAIPDGWKMVVIPALLRFRGHVIFPLAPTTPARNPTSQRASQAFRPSHIRPPQIGNPSLWTPGGQGRPPYTPVRVSLCGMYGDAFADCSLCCVCWPASSSQRLCRSLRVCKSQRGSGKVVTLQDLQLNPWGWCWWWVRWSHSGSDVTFRANMTVAANASLFTESLLRMSL